MVRQIIAGIVTGLLWFVTLGYLDAVRTLGIVVPEGPGPHWGALLGSLAVSGVAVWLLAGRTGYFRAAVVAGLILGLLLGLLEAGGMPLNAAAAEGWHFLLVPGVFVRGFNSVAVWTALGVTATLTTVAIRQPARSRAQGVRTSPRG